MWSRRTGPLWERERAITQDWNAQVTVCEAMSDGTLASEVEARFQELHDAPGLDRAALMFAATLIVAIKRGLYFNVALAGRRHR